MDFVAATQRYEARLAERVVVDRDDLQYKYEQLADPAGGFGFLRGTYYRWLDYWTALDRSLRDAPRVAAVGDLHVENFGTWRDVEGRLVWGVNDFDEADVLPYTNDLLRLAASGISARQAYGCAYDPAEACRWIVAGYEKHLRTGGRPFVLEESHADLRAWAMAADREPAKFWEKMLRLLQDRAATCPPAAKRALLADLPDPRAKAQYRRRRRVGMGSLGKPRFVALVDWAGAWLAREAKAQTPPTTRLLAGKKKDAPHPAIAILSRAVRAPDPLYRFVDGWIIRRLGPRCSRISLDDLANHRDYERMFTAMGAEAANIHLASSPGAVKAALADLKRRRGDWLFKAAAGLCEQIEVDRRLWRKAYRAGK
jgi:hypothetical protein